MSADKKGWVSGEECAKTQSMRDQWLRVMEAFAAQVHPWKRSPNKNYMVHVDAYTFTLRGNADITMQMSREDLPEFKQMVKEATDVSRKKHLTGPALQNAGDWINMDDYLALKSSISQSARAYAWSELRSIHDDIHGFYENPQGICPIELEHGQTVQFAYASNSAKLKIPSPRYWLRRDDISLVDEFAQSFDRPKLPGQWSALASGTSNYSSRLLEDEFIKAFHATKPTTGTPNERQITVRGQNWHVADMGGHAYDMRLHIPAADAPRYKKLLNDIQQATIQREDKQRAYFGNPANREQHKEQHADAEYKVHYTRSIKPRAERVGETITPY